MSRVLQLIDSLEAGGAERFAVTLANVLSEDIEASFLCATRSEGILKSTINQSVGYLFLEKNRSLDFRAIFRLRGFVKQNKITVIHAHSTSYFIATLVRLFMPKVKLVWHDHYGQSEFLEKRPRRVLKICSYYFNHIFCVNTLLLDWSKNYLNCNSVSYLQNFAVLNQSKNVTLLKGEEGKRVLALANLRPQKDHLTLLEAFIKVKKSNPEWTLHCVGKDFNDEYSKKLRAFIADNSLDKQVFLYGSCTDIAQIISQCQIGVLSSMSEGLPISLLEYALGKLAVVATDVGDCKLIIDSNEKGKLVNRGDSASLSEAIETYIDNKSVRQLHSENLEHHVRQNFSKSTVVNKLLEIYKS